MDERYENNAFTPLAQTEKTLCDAVCPRCGRACEGQNFCSNCGYAIKADVCTDMPKGRKERKQKKSFALSIVQRSLILAMAVFMVIAAFLPITKMEMSDVVDGLDVEVSFTPLDSLVMLGNSLYSIDEEEQEELLLEVTEDLQDYFVDWEIGDDMDEISSYVKKYVSIMIRSEDFSPDIGLIAAAVLSFMQIGLSVTLLVFAALSFAALFTDKVRSFHSLSFLLMGLCAVLTFANAIAFKYMLGIGGITNILAAPICVFVFMLLILTTFFILRLVIGKEKIAAGAVVKYSLSLVFAFALLFSAFAPIINTEVRANFKKENSVRRESSALSASLFAGLGLSEAEREEMEARHDDNTNYTYAEDCFAALENYTKRQFAKGDAEISNQLVFASLFLGWGVYDYSLFFALGAVSILLLVIATLLLVWQSGYELATGKRLSLAISLSAKIVAVVMAAATLVLVIIMCSITSSNADALNLFYRASVAAGPILLLIFSVILCCIPPAISRRTTVAEKAPSVENTLPKGEPIA